MSIRRAKPDDIPAMVIIDTGAYGNYGADEKYFNQKISAPNTHILVVDEVDDILLDLIDLILGGMVGPEPVEFEIERAGLLVEHGRDVFRLSIETQPETIE